MELFDWIWNQVNQVLNVPYLLLFMLVSYLIKKYLEAWLNKITGMKWKTVYTVFFIATAFAVPFLLWIPGPVDTIPNWVKVVITYCVGTSLHELFFVWLEKKIAG